MKLPARWVLIASLLCCASALASGKSNIRIALTFDDLPRHSDVPPGVTRQQVAKDIIAALKAAHTPPVYGFVNAVHLQNDPKLAEVLIDWRAAGFPLGNHTWSHANLDTLSPEAMAEEITRDEATLEKYSKGKDWHWFRYPFLAEGSTPAKRAEIRSVLAKRGYQVATVTMSFGDYLWNAPYARCAAKHDEEAIKLLERNYLAAAEQAIDQSHIMSNALYDRDIPYVLLMHIGAFDAHMLPRLLAMYKSKGVQFVSLPMAESDPVYAGEMEPLLSMAPSMLDGRMMQRGLPLPKGDPSLTADLDTICK